MLRERVGAASCRGGGCTGGGSQKEVGRKFDEFAKKEEEEQAQLDESSMEYLIKRMEAEQTDFAYVCRFWENSWGSKERKVRCLQRYK